MDVISPIDGRVYASRAPLAPGAAAAAFAAARAAQPRWAATPMADRAALVLAAVAALRGVNDDLVAELAWSMGRPVRYGGEIGGVEERARHMAAIAEAALAPTVVEDTPTKRRQIAREPLGVVFVIAPWNYPYLTAINTIAPALIAGNTVVLKHAGQTLLVGDRFATAFAAAGLPPGVFTNVVLDHATTEGLIAARAADFVNFTGSVAGGRAIERAAAGTFTPLGLELGGKDAAYVRSDADLDHAVAGLVDGAMFNSGQCCCGIERIYVAQSLYAPFVEAAVALTQGYVLGTPLDPATTLGPMAHRRFAQVVRDQTAAAIAQGARALIDPAGFADDGGAYLAPQILVDVDHSMAVMRDESFGPVVGIMPVADDVQALALMNDSPYGLTAAIWTADLDRAATLGAGLQVGTVFMNRCDYLDPALCWTGCKDTGRGGALGVIGYHNLTRPKSYHLRTV